MVKYNITWSPDSRYNYGHWRVGVHDAYDYRTGRYGCHQAIHYTYLSDALRHPIDMQERYPDRVFVHPPKEEDIDKARRYYGHLLEVIINENEGAFYGC